MTTGVSSSDTPTTTKPHGPAQYRTTEHGTQVVIPTRCPSGRHILATTGYRIVESEQVLHIDCQACTEASQTGRWSLTTNGNRAVSAEFDDRPYTNLLSK
jgi:hypothetical protein